MKIAVASRAFFRLELSEALRSRWLAFTAAIYGSVLCPNVRVHSSMPSAAFTSSDRL